MSSRAEVVIVTSRSFGSGHKDPIGLLAAHGLGVCRADSDHDARDVLALLPRAAGWIAGVGPITERHLDRAAALRIVARHGVGTDAIDLAAAARRGVVVTNTPGANTDAVAEHALALLLAALRHVVCSDGTLVGHERGERRARELGALTVGIVGWGRVGRTFGRRLMAFGTKVLAYDPHVARDAISTDGAIPTDLDELLATCDAVSLHAPGGSVRIDAAALARVRAEAILVNTARADLIVEQDLSAALHAGRLAGAALDVIDDEANSPLLTAPNCIITPHIAAHTVEAIDRMGMTAAEEVIRVLSGLPPAHPVVAAA